MGRPIADNAKANAEHGCRKNSERPHEFLPACRVGSVLKAWTPSSCEGGGLTGDSISTIPSGAMSTRAEDHRIGYGLSSQLPDGDRDAIALFRLGTDRLEDIVAVGNATI